MNFYFASSPNKDCEKACFKQDKILFSYHYYKDRINDLTTLKKAGKKIFVDSGAFSAHSKGAKINIDRYCRYLENVNADLQANLDSIGNAEESYQNLRYIEKSGIKVMPVFHKGEDINYLLNYIEQYDYIALGGMVKSADLSEWIDKVWQEIYKRNQNLKVHGFGLTTLRYIIKYPWCSIDSSSWVTIRFAEVARFIDNKIQGIPFYLDKKGQEMGYKKGDPVTKIVTEAISEISCQAYNEMIAYANKKILQTDYSWLATQDTLFAEAAKPIEIVVKEPKKHVDWDAKWEEQEEEVLQAVKIEQIIEEGEFLPITQSDWVFKEKGDLVYWARGIVVKGNVENIKRQETYIARALKNYSGQKSLIKKLQEGRAEVEVTLYKEIVGYGVNETKKYKIYSLF